VDETPSAETCKRNGETRRAHGLDPSIAFDVPSETLAVRRIARFGALSVDPRAP
jgi:hypothetical protein